MLYVMCTKTIISHGLLKKVMLVYYEREIQRFTLNTVDIKY
jgi:hypothetical protein